MKSIKQRYFLHRITFIEYNNTMDQAFREANGILTCVAVSSSPTLYTLADTLITLAIDTSRITHRCGDKIMKYQSGVCATRAASLVILIFVKFNLFDFGGAMIWNLHDDDWII